MLSRIEFGAYFKLHALKLNYMFLISWFYPIAAVDNEGNNTSRSQCASTDMDFSDDDYDDDTQPSIYEPLSYGSSTRKTQRTTSPPPAPACFLNFMHSSSAIQLSHRARFLITGQEGMGQSTHFAPAVLYSMEHLKVYVLDLPSLFGVSARVPEEACSQVCFIASNSSIRQLLNRNGQLDNKLYHKQSDQGLVLLRWTWTSNIP